MSELPPKDKRTKAYKKRVKNHEQASTGVGDTVQKITKATGIEKAVKFLAGEDCGCDERKEKLNYLSLTKNLTASQRKNLIMLVRDR